MGTYPGVMSRRPPLAFIFTVTLTGILNNTLVTPVIPDILSEFERSDASAGLLVATGSLAGIVVAPVAGFLADRFGRRVVLTTCLAVFGFFGGLAALAPTFEILLLARLLQGFGSAALINLAVVLIGDNWSGSDRTRLIGRNSSVLTIGLASMPLLSGVVTEASSWRVAFAIYTLALFTAAAAWLILDNGRPTDPPHVRDQFGAALVVLRRPVILATLLSGFLVFVAIFGLYLTILPIHLDDVFGLGAGARGLVIALPAVTATLASFNLGRIAVRTSARTVVLFSAVTLALAYVVIGVTTAMVVLIVATLMYGTSEGFFIPMLQDLNVGDAPDEHRAVAIAAWVGAARLGQTIGPLLAGFALGLFDTGTAFVAGAAIPVLILLVGLFGPFPSARARSAAQPG